MSVVLYVAAAYNVVWGGFVVLAPVWTLGVLGADTTDLDPLTAPIWQCVGMIVGVYGVGYAVAARDPLRHWPIVLVGLLGKLFGPIGFVDAVFIKEVFPVTFGYTIVTNDLIWWVPFGLMLHAAWTRSRADRAGTTANG